MLRSVRCRCPRCPSFSSVVRPLLSGLPAMWDVRFTVLRCGLYRKSDRVPTETAPYEPAPSGGLFQPDFVSSRLGWNLRSDFTPSQTAALLASHRSPDVAHPVISVLSSTPSPGFTGRNFCTTTGSSATPHTFGSSSRLRLACPLFLSRNAVRGFPGYCTGSLHAAPPSITS